MQKITSTKELARKLGVLRERKLCNVQSQRTFFKTCQKFSFLMIIDFESTCWEGNKTCAPEIIEFPVILLNMQSGEIESEFHYYVQPQENPYLSSFCRNFTGISQEQVENGIPLLLCLQKLSDWLKKMWTEKNVCTVGDVRETLENDSCINLAAFVTWSDWDLGVCLHDELKRKHILKPPCLNQWIDLRALYTTFCGHRPKGLKAALKDVGLEFWGREHSGLHDARNTAYLAWKMIQNGCIMHITKSLKSS